MVREALHACGAADALRNKRLPESVRREYQRAYDGHDIRGRSLIVDAYNEHLRKRAAGEPPSDVLPLYYAVFLIHASGVSHFSLDSKLLLTGTGLCPRLSSRYQRCDDCIPRS